jgi:dipeptidyl aminopeptidase/acylaminoacyl peptidase
MSTRPLLLVTALTVTLAGCLHFDTFVFEALPVKDPNADLMAASQIPAQYRKEELIPETDGTTVDAYLLTHDATDNTPVSRHNVALLYCHGQDTNIETTVPRLDMLWLQGYTVLAFDYRGFGKTVGTPTDVGVNDDTHAAYDWLAAQKPAYKIGVYGRSLGTAMCLKVAVDRQATALVLESPISSIQEIINESTTLTTPSEYYVDSQLNNLTEIPGYAGDLLIMHGLSDTYVPYVYGEQLNALAQGHAKVNTLWLVPGADHDTVPCTSKVHATIDNSCVGGVPEGVSPDYFSYVNALYDDAFAQ